MPRYKLTVEYDGTPFVGWQIQENGPSVQGELALATSRFCGEKVSVHGAGRTDAGRANPEGQRVKVLDVEPDHQGAGVVVGTGADRLAEPREAEEHKQQRRHDHGSDRRVELGGVDDQGS